MESTESTESTNFNVFTNQYVNVRKDGSYELIKDSFELSVEEKKGTRLGVMLVGWGGNNGSTLTASLLAKKKELSWYNRSGIHYAEFLGSVSQMGSVHIGYDENAKVHSRLFRDLCDMFEPDELVIGGWDICSDNLYTAAVKAGVLDHDLLNQLKLDLQAIIPLPSIYEPGFIATNQAIRADNVMSARTKRYQFLRVVEDIVNFRTQHCLDQVIVVWTASTERFHNGEWKNNLELVQAIHDLDPEVPPSVMFAAAAAETGSIFLNGSPQNTICPAVVDRAKLFGTFVGGEDFKTGQTKLKSVLVDWLASSGVRPLSIVSYNHLGNNDGKNLDETPQFRSKEITKKNVIDDIVEENPQLFPNGAPDHAVVIKYIPAVGDSKRAMDEYYSELCMDGRHTLAIHNVCEDSLLAVPLILDIVLFAEFFSRIRVSYNGGPRKPLGTVLSLLSLFFKAPAVNDGEPLVNAFFRQRYGLENFVRVLNSLPPLNHINLNTRL